MTVPEPAPRHRGLGWRFYALGAVGLVVIGLVVFAITQAMHFSSGASQTEVTTVGFFVPKSATPVSFRLPSLTPPATAETSFGALVGKPLVLNLWASDCTVCTTETPALERVARQLGDRVNFVGIDTLDGRGAGLAFVRKYGVTYRQLFDANGVVASGYGVPGLPVTVFVSAAGKVVGENVGALSVTSLHHYLDALFGV